MIQKPRITFLMSTIIDIVNAAPGGPTMAWTLHARQVLIHVSFLLVAGIPAQQRLAVGTGHPC